MHRCKAIDARNHIVQHDTCTTPQPLVSQADGPGLQDVENAEQDKGYRQPVKRWQEQAGDPHTDKFIPDNTARILDGHVLRHPVTDPDTEQQAGQDHTQLDVQVHAQDRDEDQQPDQGTRGARCFRRQAAAEPEGEHYEEVYEEQDEDDEDIEEEIIVIEEIIEDGEDFEEVIVVEEEVYDDEEEYEEYVEESEEEEMVEEVYEEIVEEESVKTEENDQPFVPVQAFSRKPKEAEGPPPQVPLIDPPRQQQASPPSAVPSGPPQPVVAGPPQPVPAGPPKPVPAREAGPKNAPSALAANKANVANTNAATDAAPEAAKSRKKWIPMSQRFPDKFKSKDPAGQKALAAASAPPPVLGAPISKSDKLPKLKPLPWRPKTYPTAAASPAGKETPMEKLLGSHLLKNVQMQKITVNAATQGQGLVCLYFGAAWRKECKALHQNLIDFYRLTTKDEQIEFVYVSADRTLFEFKDIFQKFDFLAMPTGTTQLKNTLTKALKIVDMPVVAVFDTATGHVITADAAHQILDWPSRDKAAALALVQSWKQTKPVPMDKLKRNTGKAAAADSQVKKGNLIWS